MATGEDLFTEEEVSGFWRWAVLDNRGNITHNGKPNFVYKLANQMVVTGLNPINLIFIPFILMNTLIIFCLSSV